ncbi:MAG TPA: class I SAM-dependent methyltransferase [Thermoleophilaceae bacterium]|nr:class I SAM-dependent methyltransferase [Thermoleophilaceae bacterium]
MESPESRHRRYRDELDGSFREYLEEHPGATYAEFCAEAVLDCWIRPGRAHATLGGVLASGEEWRAAGSRRFETLRQLAQLEPMSTAVDYGCGTLRIGVHMIEYLEPGHYVGLDVSEELLALGRDLAGAALLEEKRPVIAPITENVLRDAEAMEPDCVISEAVCTHVHPDEASDYFGNLTRLTAKPGAVLLFSAAVGDRPVPGRNLVWPLGRYVEALPELRFVAVHGGTEKQEHGATVLTTTLEFRRD